MKKRCLIIISIVLLIVAGSCAIFFTIKNNTKFYLDENYYEAQGIQVISKSDLESLVRKKSSFILFVSQLDCRTAEVLRQVISVYIVETAVQVFEISPNDLRESGIAEAVRFYPSVLIFKDGQLADFLEADNNDDAPAYTTRDGLRTWLEQKIILEKPE